MYLPPLSAEDEYISSWEYRRSLIKDRVGRVDADIVCLQEVSPLTFEDDFEFMTEHLGYDGVELFHKGRFRPATFWKKSRVELVGPAQHKDRTLLTTFRLLDTDTTRPNESVSSENWHVLNCHLQAGKQGGRRVRQIVEGVSAAYKLAKKLKEKDPANLNLIVCGDFNGGEESGAVHYLEKGSVGPDFIEDGESVSSKEKCLPLPSPLMDVVLTDEVEWMNGCPPPTLVVPELISLIIDQGKIETCYINPQFSADTLDRFQRIYERFASVPSDGKSMQMGKLDVERWLTAINGRVGRGSEFRSAAKSMGWVEPSSELEGSGRESNKRESTTYKSTERSRIKIPEEGILSLEDFVGVYLEELRQGKFWGIAWDLATLGEPLPVENVFTERYDRMYCSKSLFPAAVLHFHCKNPCPNKSEPSDHLPIAASFTRL
ncbi:hypothetical protein HJC23_009733 [Cyclotella cryptica]|uniref:Endonuclease/exonuclease/phosphatase domain-containing protein n=1 Tax=Cyclotella cryptica TaxID=29204 RepID=A0ABD3PP23_9STRA